MRLNRKGVTDLPIKLLVISVILSLSIPIIVQSVEASDINMDRTQMENESRKISNTVTTVYYSMYGTERTVEVSVPQGCYMILGGSGDDAFSIRMYRGDSEVSRHWMEKPIISFKDETMISGNCTVGITTSGQKINIEVS